MAQIDETWKTVYFKVKVHREGIKETIYVLEDIDDVQTCLDESLAQVNTILGSRFVKPLRTEAEGWKKVLVNLSKVLENWIVLQSNWIYLENIFNAGDIKRQLP